MSQKETNTSLTESETESIQVVDQEVREIRLNLILLIIRIAN